LLLNIKAWALFYTVWNEIRRKLVTFFLSLNRFKATAVLQ